MICIDDIINPKTVILCLTDECEKDSEKVEIKTDPNAVAITVSFPPNSYLFGVKGNQNVDVKLNNDGTAMIVKDMCVFNESKDGRCIPSGDCHKCSKGYIPMVPSEAKAGDKVKIVNFKYDESPSCEFVDVTGYFVGPTGFYVQCIKSKGCKLMANPDGSESLPSKYTFGNMDYFDDSLYLNMGHYQEEEEGKMINYFFKFPMSYKPEKKYLISHNPYYYESGKKVGIFNWHDEADYYVVNYGRNYVLFDSTFNKHEYCSINNNKLLINNKDFCSAESFGKYYDCIDGICKSKDKTKNTRSDEIEKNYEIVSGNKSLDEYKEEDPIVGLTLCTSTEFNELCNSGEITKDHFCITKDGELYKSITDHCQLQYKGIYIFEFDENSYKSIYTTTNGILIYSCDNYKTCSQFINSAYYDVTKKMFYKCSLGQCQKYKGIDEINSGYYVSGATDNNKKYSELIQCTGSTVNTCSKVTTINNGYYLNGKAINLTYALIKCEEGKCIEIKSVSKGYYHSAESTKPLIYCDRVCELTEGISNSNYIIDQDSSVNESTKFITCVDTTHCSSDIVSSSGFFIDGSSSSDIILCSVYQSPTLEKSIRYYYDGNDIKTVEENNSENKYIKCENIPHKGTDKAPMNFLTDTGIIHCISSGCSFIQAPETAEANFHVSNNQDLLMCNNSKCYKVVDVKSKPYAYISASDSDYKTLIFCEPGEEKNICIENDISNKINTKGSLFFIDGTYPSKIISCTSSEGCKSISLSFNLINETLYFIDGTDVKNIITCSKDGCNRGNKITGTLSFTDGFDSSKTIFCVEGKECISSKSIDYCSKINENEACEINSIKINNGMHCIKDGHIYQSINDKDNSYCVKISNGEIMLKKGMNGYEKGIFGVDSGLIYSCTTSDGCIQLLSTYYLRIEIDDVKNNVNRFLYTCNIDGDCYSENKIAKGYYLSKIKENGMNTLIYCSSSEVSNCQHSSEIDKNGNMLFEIPNGQFLDQGNTKNIIKCPSGKNCESEMGITDFGYAYIDNENFKIVDNPVSPKQKIKIYPSVILCTKEFGCKSYLGETTKDYGYINSNNKEVIVCTANYGCEIPIEHTSTTYYNYAMDPIYIITWPYPNDNCIINKDCNVKTGINCVDKTYYLVNDIKDYMVQTNKDTPSPLFYCKATNNKTIKCNEVNGIGYYINNEKEIYTCTKDGCTGSEFDKNTTGKIVATDYYQFKIYLTMNITTKLKSPAKNYMVAHEGAGNIFGTKQNGEYAIITVDENSATLNTTIESNHGSFFYTNSDTNEILKGGECPISSIIELAISEYICTKESNICTEIIY
ncbi:hypothetical protein BCR36DRAFT_584245 [Piromyces finnis]|uniref:Scaffoldin n=1 Tax=Piromyces finnis TaxID=1754191 RepID=A0A1Y1V6V0_9FUNG|nr:hypothetical protein BCR36DRAFT_584245 [Piromyces finnis]|eukprot:ORX48692.1 hypothetical protein BCR36DRAFT_584245 [Piromyces finnis]